MKQTFHNRSGTDAEVIATFERICLSRFLGYPTGEYLKPESWRCSMIWSATMGLPLSLEGVTNQKAL